MALLDELKAVDDTFNTAIDRGDAKTAAAQFTADGICTAPNMPIVRGFTELADYFQTWVDAGLKNPRDSDHVAESEGDIAYMTCSYASEYHGDDGSITKEQGRTLQIFKRDDSGNWKMHRFGISTDFDY